MMPHSPSTAAASAGTHVLPDSPRNALTGDVLLGPHHAAGGGHKLLADGVDGGVGDLGRVAGEPVGVARMSGARYGSTAKLLCGHRPGTKLILQKHGSRAPQVPLLLQPTCANSCLKYSYSSLGRMLRGGQDGCVRKVRRAGNRQCGQREPTEPAAWLRCNAAATAKPASYH